MWASEMVYCGQGTHANPNDLNSIPRGPFGKHQLHKVVLRPFRSIFLKVSELKGKEK